MPPQDVPPDPYRYRQAWGASARRSAANRVRQTISGETGLLKVSEAVAELMSELFSASACSITLLDERGYRDLVNVGRLAPGEERFPDDFRYSTAQYPLSTRMLLEGGGYLSASVSSPVYQEYQTMYPQMPAGSFLGVPIFAGAEVRGELYLVRDAGTPVFTSEDVDMARDLATQYGAVLPDLLGQDGATNH